MFPSRLFPNRMFAPRYFPKAGSSVEAVNGPLLFTATLYRPGSKRGGVYRAGSVAADVYRPGAKKGALG